MMSEIARIVALAATSADVVTAPGADNAFPIWVVATWGVCLAFAAWVVLTLAREWKKLPLDDVDEVIEHPALRSAGRSDDRERVAS